LREQVGHDTATVGAFSGGRRLSGPLLPIDSPARTLAASLRLNAKRGIVGGLDAAGPVRIRD
jgi:hypothetical protein